MFLKLPFVASFSDLVITIHYMEFRMSLRTFYVWLCIYIYIYSSKSLDVVQSLYFGSKLPSSGTYK